jgi:hypothetical protein
MADMLVCPDPECRERSLYFNEHSGLYECLNPHCRRKFTVAEIESGRVPNSFNQRNHNVVYRPIKYRKKTRRRFTNFFKILGYCLLFLICVGGIGLAYVYPFTTSVVDAVSGRIDILKGNGEKVRLINNRDSKNPTWEELLAFLKEDTTDEIEYTSTFVCADFAETLHNNAEKKGIRCGFVTVGKGEYRSLNPISAIIGSHALNAFQTVDRGLVYIDCTGMKTSRREKERNDFISQLEEQKKEYLEQGMAEYDKVAGQAIGRGMVMADSRISWEARLTREAEAHYQEELLRLEQELSPPYDKIATISDSGLISFVSIFKSKNPDWGCIITSGEIKTHW